METRKSAHLSSTASALQQAIRVRPLVSFFVLAYGISWILEIPFLLSEWGILSGNYLLTFILKGFGPTLAALIITGVIEGRSGLLRLRQRVTKWQVGWQWYIFVLLGIPALFLLGMFVQPGVLASFQGFTASLLVSYPIYFAITFFGGGPLGEEIGWRGFALPRMQPRYGPLKATLLLGLLWTFWHLPDFLSQQAQGGGPGTGWATFLTNFPIFMVMVITLAIILTWIFNHTRGSLLMSLLAHTSVNTPQLTLVPLFLNLNWTSMDLGYLIGLGVTALMVIVFTRGRLGYRHWEGETT